MTRARLGAAALFLSMLLALPAGAHAAGPMDWSAPVTLDPRALHFEGGDEIACPSALFCVAVDNEGDLLLSEDPDGGADGWQTPRLDTKPGDRFVDISCPSTSFCAALTRGGAIFTSSEPMAAPDGWRRVQIGGADEMSTISCAGASLCVAGDRSGDGTGHLFVSSEPSGGPDAWEKVSVPGALGFQGISCPSISFCAAVDAGDHDGVNGWESEIFTSTDPTGGASAWQGQGVTAAGISLGISCSSSSMCVSSFREGILVSGDPTAGAAAWSSVDLGERPELVSCPSDDFCAAAGLGMKHFWTSQEPLGSAGAWDVTDTSSLSIDLRGLSCPSTGFCAVLSWEGDVATSEEPGGGPATWQVAPTGGFAGELSSVSCPSPSFCAVTQAHGRLFTSAEPTNPASWQTVALAEGEVWDLSCAGPAWCVALGEGPSLLYSTDPAGGAAAWSSVARSDGRNLACPAPTLCVTLSGDDEVLTSTDPLSGPGSWVATEMELPEWRLGPNRLEQLSCPTVQLCVVGGDVGTILASSEPSGGLAAWVKSGIGGGASVDGLDCTISSFCAATTWGDTVATTQQPLGGSSAWADSMSPDAYFPGPISCADEAPLCVAIDRNGFAIASRSPGLPSSQWGVLQKIDDEERLRDVSCAPDGSFCLVTDRDGRVIVGVPSPPEEKSGPGPQGDVGAPASGAGAPGAAGLSPSSQPPCRRAKRPHRKRRDGAIAIGGAKQLSSVGKHAKNRCGRLP